MLVLTRFVGQDIIIGEGKDAIHIKLLSTQRGKASIGVIAPRHIPVHREEIFKKIHKNDNH